MKYEAKNDSLGDAVSVAAGTPLESIGQADSIAKASAACTGCHLITEKEWMTLAQNVLSVPSNWSGGAVGSGYIYSGHNDYSPSNALAASTDDDGYSGTGNNASDVTVANGVVGKVQKRTLTLTNGQVIWDLAGNVWEWTAGQATGGQPGLSTDAGFNWHEWNAINTVGTLAVNPNLSTTGLTGVSGWTSANGVGQIYSYTGNAALRGFIRGGDWRTGVTAGVATLFLNAVPSDAFEGLGFRVAR